MFLQDESKSIDVYRFSLQSIIYSVCVSQIHNHFISKKEFQNKTATFLKLLPFLVILLDTLKWYETMLTAAGISGS